MSFSVIARDVLKEKSGIIYTNNFQTLANKNYSFNQIVNHKIDFKPINNNQSQLDDDGYYWLRWEVVNIQNISKKYYLRVFPNIDNVIYFQSPQNEKWLSKTFGLASKNLQTNINYTSITLNPNSKTVFYIKTKIIHQNQKFNPLKFNFILKPSNEIENNQRFMEVSFLITLFVMLSFFIYNLYLYYFFKDRSYLYYLIILVGGLLYITAINKFFYVFTTFRFFQIQIINSNIFHFDLNDVWAQLGLTMVITGFVQLTRFYLNTPYNLPLWDKLLKILFFAFIAYTTISVSLTISGFMFLFSKLTVVNNTLIASVIILIFIIGIVANKKGFALARYFLWANSLPLAVIMLLTLYLILYSTFSKGTYILPNIAIISQGLTFAIALVARVNLLKQDLAQKQNEVLALKNEYTQVAMRNKYILLENEYILKQMELEKGEKQKLQIKLDSNYREFSANTIYNLEKNSLLQVLQSKVSGLGNKSGSQQLNAILEINSLIKSNILLENDWEKFKLHFEQVHPNFFKALQEKHPSLTAYEIKLSAYLHLKLSTKEIALLLNIDPASVRKAKMRLNKKMIA